MALVPFDRVDPSALRWLRVAETPVAFSLRSAEAEIATLTWARAGGSLANARTSEASWTLKRSGFLQPTVLVRESGRPEPIARLSAHFTRHEIAVRGGPTFRLRHVSHLLPAWSLTTDRGAELMHIEPVPEGRTLRAGAMVVAPAAPGSPTLLLAVLAWYVVVLTWFEDEALEALAPFEGPDPPLARGGGPS